MPLGWCDRWEFTPFFEGYCKSLARKLPAVRAVRGDLNACMALRWKHHKGGCVNADDMLGITMIAVTNWQRSQLLLAFSVTAHCCEINVCLKTVVGDKKNALQHVKWYLVIACAVWEAKYPMVRSVILNIEGILLKGPYPPCLRMADRALLAGYPRYVSIDLQIISQMLPVWHLTGPNRCFRILTQCPLGGVVVI